MRQAVKLVLVALLGVAALGTTGCTELVDLFSDAVRGVSSDSASAGSGDPEGEILGKSGKAEAVPTFDHGPGDGVSSGLRAGLVDGNGQGTGATGLGTILPQGGNPYASAGTYLPTSTGAPRMTYADAQGVDQGVSYSPYSPAYSPSYATADASMAPASTYTPASNRFDQYGYDGNSRSVQVNRSEPASVADYSSDPSGYSSSQPVESMVDQGGGTTMAQAMVEDASFAPSLNMTIGGGADDSYVAPAAMDTSPAAALDSSPMNAAPMDVSPMNGMQMDAAPMDTTPAAQPTDTFGPSSTYGQVADVDYSRQGLGNMDMGMDPSTLS